MMMLDVAVEIFGRNLTLLTFSSMVPGMMILILGFFCILHSWMNAFAEMMRFADREFYQVCSLRISIYSRSINATICVVN